VAHVAGRAIREAQAREVVVVPERPVDEDEIAGGEPADHAVVQPGEPGGVGDRTPGVAEREAARLELCVRAEIARGVAAGREQLDHEARAGERLRPLRVERPPLGAAVAPQHRQDGIPVGQRALDACGAEDVQRRRRLAQQQESGGVVDLRVRQQHARDRRRADAAALRVERLELLTEVGRGVDQEPGPVVAADREGRLGPRSRAFTRARGLARLAAAVPLRKAAAGGRAQDANAHAAPSEGRRPRRASAA
jgi:hypothetical protein